MITNFEEITQDLRDTEKELLPILINGLKNKTGKGQAVTGSIIIKAFEDNKGVKLTDARLRKMINVIRINNLIPCLCSSKKGYYIAVNQEEIKDYIQSLDERISAIQAVRDAVHDQYIRRNKQNSMF